MLILFILFFKYSICNWIFLFQKRKRRAEGAHGAAGNGETSCSVPGKRLKPLYHCAKCGFTSEEQAQFQEHIPQHRTDSDAPQCQHCGLCFTSQLALSRHLIIVHKVKEPEKRDDFIDEDTGKGQEHSTDLSDETTPLSAKKTGLSTDEVQSKLHSELTDTQASETSGFEEEKAWTEERTPNGKLLIKLIASKRLLNMQLINVVLQTCCLTVKYYISCHLSHIWNNV